LDVEQGKAMTSRRALHSLIVLAVTLSIPRLTRADPSPNVVLIVCDDQAWFHFGFMGN
jgi:hypothetical protein